MRIGYDNWVDDYTLLYSTQETFYPASNVQEDPLSTYWKSEAITNLITYGNCENANSPTLDGGTSGLANATWARSAAQKQAGSYSWLLTKTSAAAAGDAINYLTDTTDTDDMHGLTAGKTYKFSIYMYTDAATVANSKIIIQEYYSAAWHDSVTLTISSGSTWEQEITTLTLNSSTTGITIKLEIDTAEVVGKLLYIDEIYFYLQDYIILDSGSGNTLNPTLAGIAGHNLSSAASIKIQGNATNSWSSPTIDETITYDSGTLVKFVTGSALRFWRFLFDDPDNSDGYIKIGRLFVGEYEDITQNSINFKNIPNDSSIEQRSMSGQKYGITGTILDGYEFNIPYISNAMKTTINTIYESVRKYIPFFFIMLETDMTNLKPLYCTFENQPEFDHVFDNNYRTQIEVREAK